MDKLSFYDRLGLPKDASPEEIRHAYRQLVMHLHPDTNVNKGETELFIDIQDAYDQLSDPTKRSVYDHSLSRHPDPESPLHIRTFYSQPTITRLPEPQLFYVLLELSLHLDENIKSTITPLNISLVVDCSTSMQGIRLDTVKLTAIELIRQLHQADLFSLIKFNDKAELLLPAAELSDIKSTEMKIQLLQAGGGTEIFKGLELGFQQVDRYRSSERVNHIILITDGRTYGDELECEKLADQAFNLGVGISALGIGTKWNDVFLEHITSKTGGICKYVSDNTEIRTSILDEIGRLGSGLTENITYNFTDSQYIELRSAFRLHPEASPLAARSPLIIGTMPEQGTIEVLLEFLIQDISPELNNLFFAKGFINYRIPNHPIKSQFVQRLELERKIVPFATKETPPNQILNAITLLSLYRMQERARNEVIKGDIKSATRHLQLLATHLINKGEGDLAKSVMDEVKFIQNNQSFSEDGEKRLEYGTRALLLPERTEERD